MKLSVYTPERKLVESIEVEQVTLPGSEGQIQILPGHVNMIGSLQTGVFAYQIPGKPMEWGAVSTGFFEVNADLVSVMAETLELKSEIDVSRAKNAQTKAEAALQEAELDEHKFKKYQLKLQRALVRQHLGTLND